MKKNKGKVKSILLKITDQKQIEAIQKTVKQNPKMRRSTLYNLCFISGINSFKGLPY